MRVVGSLGALFVVGGVLFGVGGAVSGRDVDGWGDLIVFLALFVGALMVLAGALCMGTAHVAFCGWRDGEGRRVRNAALWLALIGATFWLPYVFQANATPLDLYLLQARFVLLLFGAWWLYWAYRCAPASD